MKTGLQAPLTVLPGIGARRAKTLEAAGLSTLEDLLLRLPARHEDRRRLPSIASLAAGVPATIRARIASARVVHTRRRGFSFVDARLEDETASLRAVWFNQPWLVRTLEIGREGFFFGAPRETGGAARGLKFENPEMELIGPDAGGEHDPIHTGRVVPIYRSVAGIPGRTLRRLNHLALGLAEAEVQEILPNEVMARRGLLARGEALRNAHFPEEPAAPGPEAGRGAAVRRLAYEELFLLQAGLCERRAERISAPRRFAYDGSGETRRGLEALLPFTLTAAQRRAWDEIHADLAGPHPMNRLLQGDTGSGKTVIAALALGLAAVSGRQGALMAPTELLAEQHHDRLKDLFAPAGIKAVLLTGSLRPAERRAVLEAAAAGDAAIVVGTHALFSRDVQFARPGVVVIDEQQRFGVSQRQQVRRRAGDPDTLVMTATPIPRSLALTIYGDLEISVLDGSPPGRKPVRTLVRGEEDRERIWAGLRREIARGRQAFIVYPLVQEGDRAGLRAAVEMQAQLAAGSLAGARIALLHGGTEREERRRTLQAFAQRALDVIVATTVLEVGVDAPNATVLIVEHAERFGLAQLHQLRGRVGRGSERAWCVLLAGEKVTEAARRRLEILASESNGFRIAEIDAELRGAGDLAGTRQHGEDGLRAARLGRDTDLLLAARADAREWWGRLAAGDAAPGRPLMESIARRFGERLALPAIG